MNKMTNKVKIVSTGRYLPKKIVTNHDLEKIVDTSDEWIYSRTGIKARHQVENEETSDLAYKAALNAMEKVNFDKEKIDLILVATFTPDVASPSVSNFVQAKLGLDHKDITCFDINAACTGFIYALNVASQMLNSNNYQHALVIGSEVISKVTDYTDRNTCVLFGDGAGAVILQNTQEDQPAYFYSASSGDLNKTLIVNPTVSMDGKKVYQFATNALSTCVNKTLTDCELSLEDIEVIIPHQANIRIIQSVSKSLGIDMDKFFINIEKYGNTSAASIAIALDEYLEQNDGLGKNKKILLIGFGGGFTWGSALITV